MAKATTEQSIKSMTHTQKSPTASVGSGRYNETNAPQANCTNKVSAYGISSPYNKMALNKMTSFEDLLYWEKCM